MHSFLKWIEKRINTFISTNLFFDTEIFSKNTIIKIISVEIIDDYTLNCCKLQTLYRLICYDGNII